MENGNFLKAYFNEVKEVATKLDLNEIDNIVERLVKLKKEGGRLFLLGVGGSAANCSHAVNDFRKLAGIEAYSPVDNVAELTARTNDEGWDTVFSAWLRVSQVNAKDVILIFSVGGGNREKNISANLVSAIDEAKGRNIDILGIVGRDGGYTKEKGTHVVIVPTVNPKNVTPHSEAFQGVIWHGIVSDPRLMECGNKWETTVNQPSLVGK